MTDDAPRQAPDYTERLWPGPTVWILAVSMIGALAIAYASAVGAVAGWIVAFVGAVGAAVLIWRSAARIVVASGRAPRRTSLPGMGVHGSGAGAGRRPGAHSAWPRGRSQRPPPAAPGRRTWGRGPRGGRSAGSAPHLASGIKAPSAIGERDRGRPWQAVAMTSVTAPTQSSTRSMATAAAPLITMGTTLVVRKALIKGYEASTGKPAPVIANRDAPVLARILWSAGHGRRDRVNRDRGLEAVGLGRRGSRLTAAAVRLRTPGRREGRPAHRRAGCGDGRGSSVRR